MSKFFIKQEDILPEAINITGEDVNHIKKVLRLRCGDNILLCDGNKNDYLVRIEKLESDYIVTSIISKDKNNTEPPIDITLFQGVPKSDKMDFIIQKSVELGVKRIIPVITERTVVRIENKKDSDNKTARWQRIALEAAKQCNRGVIPKIEAPISFDEALKIAQYSQLAIIPYERETDKGIRSYLKSDIESISLMIGPEGGFSENEILKAVKSSIIPITLGPRILRTETAGIVAVAILMYELGDIGK